MIDDTSGFLNSVLILVFNTGTSFNYKATLIDCFTAV